MTTITRMVLAIAGAAALLCGALAAAQDWPKQKPIQLVVGIPPSSSTDIIARLVQPKLAEDSGAKAD